MEIELIWSRRLETIKKMIGEYVSEGWDMYTYYQTLVRRQS